MRFDEYHFHLYFEQNEITLANEIVKKLSSIEHLQIGRVWDKPVGPHPICSCQVNVSSEHFYEMIEWFLQNRRGLSLFIHALTGDDLKDHTDYVMWIGKSYNLNLELFSVN